jgi:hypothetical protein
VARNGVGANATYERTITNAYGRARCHPIVSRSFGDRISELPDLPVAAIGRGWMEPAIPHV